jgi:O-antigen ligase
MFIALLLAMAAILALYLLLFLVRCPVWSVYLLLLATPLDTLAQLNISQAGLSIADLLAIAAMVVLFLRIAMRQASQPIRQLRQLLPYIVLTLCILASVVMSFLFSLRSTLAVIKVLTRFETLSIFFVFAMLISDGKRLKKAMLCWVTAATFASALGIMQGYELIPFEVGKLGIGARQLGSVMLPFRRSVGLFTIYGYYGTYVLPIFAVALTGIFTQGLLGIDKRVHFIILCVISIAILVTQSRSTWLAACTVIVVVPWLVVGVHRRSYLALLFGLTLVIITLVGFTLNPNRSFLRVSIDLVVAMKSSSLAYRLEQFKLAWELFRRNSLFGMGPGSFVLLEFKELEHPLVLHNIFLNALVEQGLIGAVPLFLFFLLPLVNALKVARSPLVDLQYRSLAVGLVAGLIGVFVESSFSSGLDYLSVWQALGVTQALALIASQNQRSLGTEKAI